MNKGKNKGDSVLWGIHSAYKIYLDTIERKNTQGLRSPALESSPLENLLSYLRIDHCISPYNELRYLVLTV